MTRFLRIAALLLAVGLPAAAAGSPLRSGQVELRVEVPADPGATAELRRIFDRLIADAAADGRGFADVELDLPPGTVIRLAGMPGFVPPALPGFGAMYGSVRAIVVADDGQRALEPGPLAVAAGNWIGVRNRFHAVVLSGIATRRAEVSAARVGEPAVTFRPGPGRLALRIYDGPIEHASLRAADPRLSGLLFAALWDWLRWLCFGMLWLLTTIDGVVGHIGWSVVLLSLAVKLLMAPLTKLADRLQASVNRTQALLQPQLAEIRRHYRGEEAHERTLGVYRDHGVSPLYTLKSLVGFLIQIPVFIAAFDMLGENIALDGAAFGWIEDLSRPDHWLTLPVVLPFFGGHLNLLPLLMTGITLLTSRLQTDPHLTPELLRAQRLRLYLMAVAFFLLFYTFPAGMVLYWTTNNALHLVRILLRPPGRGSR